MTFIIFTIIIWSIIFSLLFILSWVWPPDSPWSPWWKTSAEVAKKTARLAKIHKYDVVYELGSGDGEGLISIAKTTGARCIGVEIDFFRALLAKWKVRSAKVGDRVTIIRKNFYDVNVSDATVIYCYLVPRALRKLLPKLEREVRPGTKLISYRYEVPSLKQIAFDRKEIMYVYEIEGKRRGKKVKHGEENISQDTPNLATKSNN